jgi:hypothetical protein
VITHSESFKNGRTSLDEWSARSNKHKSQTFMPQRDSNPQSQQASIHWYTLYTSRPVGSAAPIKCTRYYMLALKYFVTKVWVKFRVPTLEVGCLCNENGSDKILFGYLPSKAALILHLSILRVCITALCYWRRGFKTYDVGVTSHENRCTSSEVVRHRGTLQSDIRDVCARLRWRMYEYKQRL